MTPTHAHASTIEDVARVAGVHASTASRVLRGISSQSVSPATRTRIHEVAKQLHYRPNAFARGLRLQKTNTLALLTPYLESLGFNEIARGIVEGAAEAGFMVLTTVVGSGSELNAFEQLVQENRVDGLIAAYGRIDDPQLREVARTGVPLVAVNRRVRGVPGSVVVDDARASELAVAHLVAVGHRRLGHISGQEGTDTSARREQGFRDACRRLGAVIPNGSVVSGDYSVQGGERAAYAIAAMPARLRPTAIVVADPQSALGSMKTLRQASFRLPEDMSIVALNDHMVVEHLTPSLTAVQLPFREMGRRASEMLIDLVKGGEARQVIVSEPPPRLMVRDSTCPPRLGNA